VHKVHHACATPNNSIAAMSKLPQSSLQYMYAYFISPTEFRL
jgi:hypothetical protein